MSLDSILDHYPKQIKLKSGLHCEVRPLEGADEENLHQFFLAVPVAERMFIKHRVTDPAVIRDWCQHIDLGRNLPLLALIDGKIVGDATLHQLFHVVVIPYATADRNLVGHLDLKPPAFSR